MGYWELLDGVVVMPSGSKPFGYGTVISHIYLKFCKKCFCPLNKLNALRIPYSTDCSILLKHFLKSRDTKIALTCSSLAYWMILNIFLIFHNISLPCINPIWSLFISLSMNFFILYARTFEISLKSMFSSIRGLQLAIRLASLGLFRISMTMPFLADGWR